jgi:hypothetical protein
MVASQKYGNSWTSPCPSLRPVKGFGGEQFLCGEVLDTKNIDEHEAVAKLIGGVGDESGCSSPMFNEKRDVCRRKLMASKAFEAEVKPASKDSTCK